MTLLKPSGFKPISPIAFGSEKGIYSKCSCFKRVLAPKYFNCRVSRRFLLIVLQRGKSNLRIALGITNKIYGQLTVI